MGRSNESYLRWQLGRWGRKYAPNITMLEEHAPADVMLDPGERAIALVALASGGATLVVTDTRIMQGDATLVRYANVRCCHWIDRDQEVAAKLKRTRFQRLIVEQFDGRDVVLDDLGQAVFPLLKFFWFKLAVAKR